MWFARRREGACQPFYCLPRCGCRRCLLPFLRSCGFLTRCFGEGVAALIVDDILILVSWSEDIEREGLLPSCFICPLCLTASSTQACSSAPQLVLAGLLTVFTGICMRQLFSAPFQCRIFLLIDGRHSVRRATLIGLCGTARQRHRRKQADFFIYIIASCAQVFFHMFCWALKQRSVRNYACVEFFLPCELRATPRGCHFDSAESLCLFAWLAGKFHAACYCWCVPKCCHSMRIMCFSE
ncbi:retrotransposon hot spot (RHS) protein [Trypanosoma cruzi]|nr:retrotransposon hot spot (RHS) protein [Trypanosoma cruzi]